MRLLFVHEVNWARKVVFEIHDFPELLSLRGHEVVFIDYAEDTDPQGVGAWLDLRTEVAVGSSRAHPGSAVEVRTPGRVLPPPLDRLVASITQVPAIYRALRDGHFDAVVLYGVPTNGWQTVRLAQHFGVPVLFRSIDVSHALRDTRLSKLIRIAERSVIRRSTAVSTHNQALADYCISEGADPDRVSIEVPGLDLDRFSPAPRRADLAERYGIGPDDVVIEFMGTFYRFAGIEQFVEGIAPRLTADPSVKVLLVGGGESEAAIRSTIQRTGTGDQVIFTGFIDYPELADHLRLADIAITPFEPSVVTDCALPGKALQYLGCGLPTVSSPLAGLAATVPEGRGILYRSPGEEFVDAVWELAHDPQRRAELAISARSVTEELFDWELCVTRFEAAIARTIELNSAAGAAPRTPVPQRP